MTKGGENKHVLQHLFAGAGSRHRVFFRVAMVGLERSCDWFALSVDTSLSKFLAARPHMFEIGDFCHIELDNIVASGDGN